MTHDRTDVYTRITAEIVAAIEAGAGEFKMPWHHNGTSTARPANIASGKGYRGVNVLALWVAAEIARYDNGLWGTYRQWQALDAQVRKGERGTTVVLWKEVTPAGERRPARRSRTVRPAAFSPGHSRSSMSPRSTATGPSRSRSCRRPSASPMPRRSSAISASTPCSAARTPTTGPQPTRCTCPISGISMKPRAFTAAGSTSAGTARARSIASIATSAAGSAPRAYALEEISVELLSGMILADLGIAHHPRPDHAAYVASWLRVLKDDPRAIFTAAGKAQQAADWMHARQPQATAQAA